MWHGGAMPGKLPSLAAGLLVTGALAVPHGTAAAAPCPDVEAVFARGTFAPQGLGDTGQDFVDALRGKLGGKSLGVYAVVYPASTDFPTAVDGIRDASNHVTSMATTCPDTRLVLAGYSQGAAVMGFVTNSAVPGGVDPADVAAVVLFGKPDAEFMEFIDSPPVTIGPRYAGKTLELCAPGDPICSDGGEGKAHNSYTANGMVDQGAAYAAGRV